MSFLKGLIKDAKVVPTSQLGAGDTLVLTVDRFISGEQRRMLINHLRTLHAGKVVVLDPGMKLEVIKSEPLTELVGMFGMTEIEQGVARFIAKARRERLALADVMMRAEEFAERDELAALKEYGWVTPSGPGYVLIPEAVQRVQRRYPAEA